MSIEEAVGPPRTGISGTPGRPSTLLATNGVGAASVSRLRGTAALPVPAAADALTASVRAHHAPPLAVSRRRQRRLLATLVAASDLVILTLPIWLPQVVGVSASLG